eukprot:6024616-Amphidinium_carterae.1
MKIKDTQPHFEWIGSYKHVDGIAPSGSFLTRLADRSDWPHNVTQDFVPRYQELGCMPVYKHAHFLW